jgi:F-type H+-transporting ATPase subunit a
VLLLIKMPARALMTGFTFPFAVLFLKAVSVTVLESAAWRRFTASRWRAAVVVAVAAGLVWLAASVLNRADAQTGHAVTQAGAVHGAVAPTEGAAAEATHAGAADESEAETGPRRFDTILSALVKAGHGTSWGHFIHRYEIVLFSLIVALVLCLIAFFAMKDAQLIPRPFQNGVEFLVEAVYNQVVDILGPKYGPRYVPFLGTLFLYIFAMNLFGIIPMMESPTSNLNVTVALALTVFVYVQFTAMKELGILGWLDHLAGNPRSAIEWGLVPLMLPIHVIGELAKPVSLSCRLFGNIFGEDMLLVGFATLGIGLFANIGLKALPFGLPLQFPFLFLALLTSFVQALVFSMLSTIYFLLMLPHDHGHEHEGEAQHAH